MDTRHRTKTYKAKSTTQTTKQTPQTNWDESMCSQTVSVVFHFFFLFSFFFQLKSLFEIFTFVSEWSIKYQYLVLASLILVACNRNSFSRFGSIQLRLINKFNSDFESYFMSVSNFSLVCLLPIYFYFTEINIDNGVANTVKYLQNM